MPTPNSNQFFFFYINFKFGIQLIEIYMALILCQIWIKTYFVKYLFYISTFSLQLI